MGTDDKHTNLSSVPCLLEEFGLISGPEPFTLLAASCDDSFVRLSSKSV
jgi:hypothetical protein